MNKNEALKILGFSEGDNPNKRQVAIKYKQLALKFHPDKNRDEEEAVRNKHTERFKDIGNAYQHLTSLSLEAISKMKYEDIIKMTDEEFEKMPNEEFENFLYESNKRLMKNLNEINSANDLELSLKFAVLNKDMEYIKKAVSKFKSSESGQFGDYINKCGLLLLAVSSKDVKFTELLLKKGADPNTEISEFLLRQNDKIKRLLIEYGRYDKSSVFCQLALAVVASCVAFSIYSECDASFLCYVGVAAFALAGVLLVAKAIHDVFYVQTKWPSPDLDEVSVQEQGTAEGRA